MKKRRTFGMVLPLCLLFLTGCATSGSGGREAPLSCRSALIEWTDYNRELKLAPEFESVDYITIHNTAEPFTARQERDRVNSRNDGVPVSFHFAVDENEAVQILPLHYAGWHAGDGSGPGNTRSIGIEICRSQWREEHPERYYRSEENAARLAAWLLDKYDLPTAALRMHQDWSGKYCPHRILERDGWEYFKARVDSWRGRTTVAEIAANAPSPHPAELPVLIQERNGRPFYQTTTGEGFRNPDDLAAYAARRGAPVLISNWVRDNRCPELLDALRNAGVEVTGCFVLDRQYPDYARRNITGESNP